jgi:hypothetical protein
MMLTHRSGDVGAKDVMAPTQHVHKPAPSGSKRITSWTAEGIGSTLGFGRCRRCSPQLQGRTQKDTSRWRHNPQHPHQQCIQRDHRWLAHQRRPSYSSCQIQPRPKGHTDRHYQRRSLSSLAVCRAVGLHPEEALLIEQLCCRVRELRSRWYPGADRVVRDGCRLRSIAGRWRCARGAKERHRAWSHH